MKTLLGVLLTYLSLVVFAFGERPNVIVILTDDQGYGDLSVHGNPILKTPHLDQLHAESIRLTNFHVAPVCTPARGELMSGLFALRNKASMVPAGRNLMRRDIPTMAEVFKANDYSTGLFGKWHLGDSYPHRPMDRGFERVVWHKGWGLASEVVPAHQRRDANGESRAFLRAHSPVEGMVGRWCHWSDSAVKAMSREKPPVPGKLDWDLWLEPAPYRPYHPANHPMKWRAGLDFGTGFLGDMGCHIMDPAFWALDLGHPETIENALTDNQMPPPGIPKFSGGRLV